MTDEERAQRDADEAWERYALTLGEWEAAKRKLRKLTKQLEKLRQEHERLKTLADFMRDV